MIRLIATAIVFALLAGLARRLNLHTESRLQIMAFWGLVVFHELEIKPFFKMAPGILSIGVNAAVVVLAIVAVKISIEGLPHGLPAFRL